VEKLIKNCHLIDGISDLVKENCWVLINNNKIEDIGRTSEDKMPQVKVVIDAKNNYLLPGLINLHVHIERRHLRYRGRGVFRESAVSVAKCSESKRIILATRNAWDELKLGVTTIRDCASQNRLANNLRDIIIKDKIIRGPRILLHAALGLQVRGDMELIVPTYLLKPMEQMKYAKLYVWR